MKKSYSLKFLFFVLLVFGSLQYIGAQELNSTKKSTKIEGLTIYPNPVTQGKVYITTALNLTKEVEIIDALGKRVIATKLRDKALDLSGLKSGFYIIKVKEGNFNSIRRLVIK